MVKRRGRKWGKRKGAFKRRGFKTTIRGGNRGVRGKRTFRWKKKFRGGRKFSFRKLAKRVMAMPTVASDTVYDDASVAFADGQGAESMECYGAPDITNRSIIQGLTCSADSIQMKISQAIPIAPTGWTAGRSKMVVNSWEQRMQWTNLSNMPMTITIYTLRVKQDVPTITDNLDLGVTSNLLDWLSRMFNAQYGSSVVENRTIGHMAFKLTDVAKFGQWFKVSKTMTRTIQPGQHLALKKFSRKPEMLNTAKWFSTFVNNFVFIAKKGNREYFWKVHSNMTESKDAGAAARTSPAYNFNTSYHYRFSFLANDEYNFQPPAVPVTGLTLHTIYPGTSTTGDLNPAT